jgi:PAS domain S-box-containing protein
LDSQNPVKGIEPSLALFKSLADALIVTDREGTITGWNRTASDLLGYSREQALGQRCCDLLFVEGANDSLDLSHFPGCLGKVSSREQEVCIRKADESRIWVTIRAGYLDQESGGHPFIIWLLHDITAQREAELRARLIADFTFDWELWIGPEGEVLYCSPSCERITGYTVSAFMEGEIALREICHPDDRARMIEWLGTRNPEAKNDVEFRLTRRDGAESWASASWQPVHDDTGRYLGVRISIRDVNERVQSRLELQTIREQHEKVLNASPNGIQIADKSGQIIYANPAIEKILGYSAEEMIGQSFLMPMPPGTRDAAFARYERLFEEGQPYRAEHLAGRKDGHRTILDIYAFRTEINGKEVAVMNIFDVTERKETESALRDAELRLRRTVETVRDVIWSCGPNGSPLHFINSACVEMLGYPPEAFYNDPGLLTELVIAEDKPLIDGMHERQAQGFLTTTEYRIRRPDGSVRWLREQTVPLLNDRGEVVRLNGVITDVTDLRELTELKSRMIRMASHDLSNPLSHAMTYLELFIEDPPKMNDTQEMIISKIQLALNRMNQMLRDLLDLERIESGESLRREPILWDAIIEEAVESQMPEVEVKSHEVEVNVADDLPLVVGDHTQLRQALVNLISNAVKYTPEGGHIIVKAHLEAGELVTKVCDNGIGIPENAIGELFKRPFVRIKQPGTEHIPGTGLGLSLVKAVIEGHGGHVWVESTPGEGSTFGFALPSEASRMQPNPGE